MAQIDWMNGFERLWGVMCVNMFVGEGGGGGGRGEGVRDELGDLVRPLDGGVGAHIH